MTNDAPSKVRKGEYTQETGRVGAIAPIPATSDAQQAISKDF